MNTYLIAEKNANRMLHIRHCGRNRKPFSTLEVARVGFPDVAFFNEAEGQAKIAKLLEHLPEFKFELCTREQFSAPYAEGSLAGRLFRNKEVAK